MKTRNKILLITIIALASALFMGCYTPSPLYGTWTDNPGNTIILNEDYTFEASIYDTSDTSISYSGSWSTIDQVLLFTVTNEDGSSYKRNTEWEVKGAILKLSWTVGENTKQLILYHTAL